MQTIFADAALTAEGWRQNVLLRIDETGRIASVEFGSRAEGAYRVPVLLPAISNVHSHTFQRAMAGLAERRGPKGRDSFWTWREIMYRFLDLLTPDDIEAIAAFAFMEMQEAGFAACAEFHYVHYQPGGTAYDDIGALAGRICAAAQETGIGLTLLPVLYRYGGVDKRPLAGGQQRFGNDLPAFENLLASAQRHVSALPPDAGLGVAPHSIRAVKPEELKAVSGLLPGRPIHMHIAEQEPEIEEVERAYGRRPVEWLFDTCAIDERWCLIHATHMTRQETDMLARSGAVAGLCPITEANLGDGIFNGPEYRAAGGHLGVGTDSNIRISVAEELRQLEYSQRLRDRARVVLADHGASSGRTLYQAALDGGARALGRRTGSLDVGNWADLVAIDPKSFAGFEEDDGRLDGWLFTGSNDAVTDLWSAGRHRVKGGRHVAREVIAGRYLAAMKRLMGQL